MNLNDICTYHKDGWHRTLIRTVQLAVPSVGEHQLPAVEHTCACWLPQPPNHTGKIIVESAFADTPWRWRAGERVRL